MDAENSDTAELRFLKRNCCLCAKQLTNQLDWRRRMKKEHAAAWHEAEKKISSKASSIQISRPCRFCRMNFTKTPQLHTQNCLPLLQRSGAPVGSDIPAGGIIGRGAGSRPTKKFPKQEGQTKGRTNKKPGSRGRPRPNHQLQQLAHSGQA